MLLEPVHVAERQGPEGSSAVLVRALSLGFGDLAGAAGVTKVWHLHLLCHRYGSVASHRRQRGVGIVSPDVANVSSEVEGVREALVLVRGLQTGDRQPVPGDRVQEVGAAFVDDNGDLLPLPEVQATLQQVCRTATAGMEGSAAMVAAVSGFYGLSDSGPRQWVGMDGLVGSIAGADLRPLSRATLLRRRDAALAAMGKWLAPRDWTFERPIERRPRVTEMRWFRRVCVRAGVSPEEGQQRAWRYMATMRPHAFRHTLDAYRADVGAVLDGRADLPRPRQVFRSLEEVAAFRVLEGQGRMVTDPEAINWRRGGREWIAAVMNGMPAGTLIEMARLTAHGSRSVESQLDLMLTCAGLMAHANHPRAIDTCLQVVGAAPGSSSASLAVAYAMHVAALDGDVERARDLMDRFGGSDQKHYFSQLMSLCGAYFRRALLNRSRESLNEARKVFELIKEEARCTEHPSNEVLATSRAIELEAAALVITGEGRERLRDRLRSAVPPAERRLMIRYGISRDIGELALRDPRSAELRLLESPMRSI